MFVSAMEKYLVILHIHIIVIAAAAVNVTVEEPENFGKSDNISHVGVTRYKIMTAQFECYQKIMQEPLYRREGRFCNRTWDGWLCWGDMTAGEVSEQRCPDYFQDFDPSEKVTKECDETGHWFRHPESNRTWTNYTQCNVNTREKVKLKKR